MFLKKIIDAALDGALKKGIDSEIDLSGLDYVAFWNNLKVSLPELIDDPSFMNLLYGKSVATKGSTSEPIDIDIHFTTITDYYELLYRLFMLNLSEEISILKKKIVKLISKTGVEAK